VLWFSLERKLTSESKTVISRPVAKTCRLSPSPQTDSAAKHAKTWRPPPKLPREGSFAVALLRILSCPPICSSHLPLGCQAAEPHTPTIARVMPMEIRRWDSFSATNASQSEGKLAYSYLTAKRLAHLVPRSRSTHGRGLASLFHLRTPGSLSVMAATVSAMSGIEYPETRLQATAELRWSAGVFTGDCRPNSACGLLGHFYLGQKKRNLGLREAEHLASAPQSRPKPPQCDPKAC
jgi:hypothetical protein